MTLERIAIALVTLLLVLGLGVLGLLWWQGRAVENPACFESAIVTFEAADAGQMPEPGGIVFVGGRDLASEKSASRVADGFRIFLDRMPVGRDEAGGLAAADP